MTDPDLPSGQFLWPDEIRCHAVDPVARRVHADGVFTWQPRSGEPYCPFCGSVPPRFLFDAYVGVTPVVPPWRTQCAHDRPHLTPDDFRSCEADRLAAAAAWTGMEVADQKYGWPHKIYLHRPGHREAKFYTLHLRDLPAATVDAVAGVIEAHTRIRFVAGADGTFGYRTT